jgi:hypothetical protein
LSCFYQPYKVLCLSYLANNLKPIHANGVEVSDKLVQRFFRIPEAVFATFGRVSKVIRPYLEAGVSEKAKNIAELVQQRLLNFAKDWKSEIQFVLSDMDLEAVDSFEYHSSVRQDANGHQMNHPR